jgi:putative component of membrane protein insertase Oxa1/YidC/SpoIIIJ protein YidD
VRRQRLHLRLALRLISEYQARTSMQPPTCVYDESCSSYASRAVQERGLVLGGIAAWKRYRTCSVAR